MTCNIDRRGRVVRSIMGIVLLGIAAIWYPSTPAGASVWLYAAQGLLALSGGFTIFEGLAGWCAIRAMGIKTPF